MKVNLKTVCALTAFALAGSAAMAEGPIEIDGFSGSEQMITFDPGFGKQCAPYDYEGVRFHEQGKGGGGCFGANQDWGDFFLNIPGASRGIAFSDGRTDSFWIMWLPEGMNRFGVLVSTGLVTVYKVELFDASNNLLASMTREMPAQSEAIFFGYETDVPIVRVEISEPNGDNGNISLMDDVRFEKYTVATCLSMTVSNLESGVGAIWKVSDATPNAEVAIVWGTAPGTTEITGFGDYCSDFGIKGVSVQRVICRKKTDATGKLKCTIPKMPRFTKGLRVLTQASERNTCPEPCMSNLDDQIVE